MVVVGKRGGRVSHPPPPEFAPSKFNAFDWGGGGGLHGQYQCHLYVHSNGIYNVVNNIYSHITA